MLKKYIITALLVIGLVTSGFGQTAGAASNHEAIQKEAYKIVFNLSYESYISLPL